MRKLLWVGDAGCESGFAKCTHNILEVLRRTWDVAVIGLNYRGERHPWPYFIYPAGVAGSTDIFGQKRLPAIMEKEKPDLVVLQNDPWNFPGYTKPLRGLEGRPPMVAIAAVDGLNCLGRAMNDFQRVIFWTKFAEEEARKGGLEPPASVIPLGVDLEVFQPGNQSRARTAMNEHIPVVDDQMKEDDFIVLNVNRNQPRKRLDLSIRYFARWVQQYKVPNAKLYLHVAPTGDYGYDCENLAEYYGVLDRLLLAQPEVWHGTPEHFVVTTMQCADVQLSTTQGEGWGLTTLEGMACRIPQIVPDWSALGEWAKPAACSVPCTATVATPRVNVIGGIADEEQTIKALQWMYSDYYARKSVAMQGQELAAKPEYRWENIGQRYAEELEKVMVWQPTLASATQ